MRRETGRQVVVVMAFLAFAIRAPADDGSDLARAQQLAWDKHFAEAETIYRDVLARSPQSHEAAHGLAQVLLWEGSYRDARRRFIVLGDREGAATAAYWKGDFRTAEREFATIDSPFARESLSAIRQTIRASDRFDVDALDDDQPYRAIRPSWTSSMFTDPLTRWDVTAGSNFLSAPRFEARRQLPFVTIHNETVLPWQRLTLLATAGVMRFPDGSSHAVGSAGVRFRTSNASSIAALIDRRELLTNATAMRTHPIVTRRTIAWTRYADKSWMAGAEAGSLRYFDRNAGRYLQAYALMPVLRGAPSAADAAGRGGTPLILIGASAAIRDTSQSRFYIESTSGSRASTGTFDYAYRGAYTPYWTPKHLREARAIALITRGAWKLQLESGISHDQATAFGPASGLTPLPSFLYAFTFARTSHPARAALTYDHDLGLRYRVTCTAERNTTAFYAANSIHASLVRRR
ncbi:MAG TPA: tetratricopeptide repeat protein [Thermoanaerobaculia bacterium]|nr:tetratricopeptide repeat protein [Thermoanaerobaculia bacterium]